MRVRVVLPPPIKCIAFHFYFNKLFHAVAIYAHRVSECNIVTLPSSSSSLLPLTYNEKEMCDTLTSIVARGGGRTSRNVLMCTFFTLLRESARARLSQGKTVTVNSASMSSTSAILFVKNQQQPARLIRRGRERERQCVHILMNWNC